MCSSSQEKYDWKLVLHAHKILKEGSCKVAVHSPSGDTDVLLLTLADLYEYSHAQHKKT